MLHPTHYEVLGLKYSLSPKEISLADIKRAYRQLSLQHHPDKNPAADPETIKKINEAYAVLSNPSNRERYDEELLSPRKHDYAKVYSSIAFLIFCIKELSLARNELRCSVQSEMIYTVKNLIKDLYALLKENKNDSYQAPDLNQKNIEHHYQSQSFFFAFFEVIELVMLYRASIRLSQLIYKNDDLLLFSNKSSSVSLELSAVPLKLSAGSLEVSSSFFNTRPQEQSHFTRAFTYLNTSRRTFLDAQIDSPELLQMYAAAINLFSRHYGATQSESHDLKGASLLI